MAAVKELIRTESDGTISFGDYELDTKAKLDNFDVGGDIFKVKTFKDITKLEKNGGFIYESVPGTTVTGLKLSGEGVEFSVDGPADAQITLELEAETEYEVIISGASSGKMQTNLGGKLSFFVELGDGVPSKIKVVK